MEKNQDLNHSEFLDLLPEIVFEIDNNLNVQFLNQSCENILGYSKKELINQKTSLLDLIIPSDLDRIKESISQNLQGNHITGNYYHIYTKTKEIKTLEIHNNHIDKNGKIAGLRCIAIDVTEKEKINKKISSQEKHYRQIFQNFPLPYLSLNKDGDIINVNPVWEEIMGYSSAEIIGKNFSYLLSKEYVRKVDPFFEKFKNNGIISNVEFKLIKKDGSKININYHGKIEYTANGEFHRAHCVFSDITLQRKAEQTLIKSEQKLRELNATKDKFFSIIAHDLKNPFNDLMGFTQLLTLNIHKYDKSKIEQFANIIHQSSKLAHNLLENLLDWSRSQTGTLKFNPEKIKINKLIQENIDLLESTARNKNIQLHFKFDPDHIAFADANMVRTILRNLISNAIKYTKQGGNINVSSNCNQKKCEINISDNGIGISEQDIDKIFKIDESFSTMGTEHERGTGLGLILCKEFVEKNGGKLWAKSEPGTGSTFTFTLPVPDSEY